MWRVGVGLQGGDDAEMDLSSVLSLSLSLSSVRRLGGEAG
jgi:hypothetical protein